MGNNRFETGRRMVKYLAVLAAGGCLASLLVGDGTALQAALVVTTFLIFAAIFVIVRVYCRCPHCGKAIFVGIWSRTVCPRCSRSLITGKKVKGNKR